MQYPNDPTVLEASDIAAVYSDGAKVTLEGGVTALVLYATVNPHVGKDYGGAAFPQALFVTNGVVQRTLPIQTLPDPESLQALRDGETAEVAPPTGEFIQHFPMLASVDRVAAPTDDAAIALIHNVTTDTPPPSAEAPLASEPAEAAPAPPAIEPADSTPASSPNEAETAPETE